MTTPKRGDVVLVPFPFTDLTDVKRRPALVLSTQLYNAITRDVIVAQITSRVNAPSRPGDHHVGEWQAAGLLAPSLVRAKVATLHGDLLARKLGEMPGSDMVAIGRALSNVLGL